VRLRPRLLVVVSLVSLFAAAPRVPTRSHFPAAWDPANFLYGQEPRAVPRVVLAAAQLLTAAWQFLAAGPATGDAIGEGLRYSQKSGLQKARVDLGSILQTTRAAILLSDRQIEALEHELRTACPGATGIVLVGRDHPGPNWRKLMYVFPEATSVRLPASPDDAWMVASGRRITAVEDGDRRPRLRLWSRSRSERARPPATGCAGRAEASADARGSSAAALTSDP